MDFMLARVADCTFGAKSDQVPTNHTYRVPGSVLIRTEQYLRRNPNLLLGSALNVAQHDLPLPSRAPTLSVLGQAEMTGSFMRTGKSRPLW